MNTDKIYAETIANEYSVKTDSKVVALKKLDGKVKNPPTVLAYALGIAATLLFGTGMCLVMGEIGNKDTISFVIGIVVGAIGMLGVSVNYPVYRRFLAGRKEKYAGDIIRLAGEIAQEA